MSTAPLSDIGPRIEPAVTPSGVTVVCLDSPGYSQAALRWAAEHAQRQHSPITLAVRTETSPGLEAFANALTTVRETAPDCALAFVRPCSLRDLRELTKAGNDLLVLSADAPNAIGHALDARCRVAFVPHYPIPDGPVLLGVTPSTAQAAIECAFQEAADRDAVLRAVRVWFDPSLPIGLTTPDELACVDFAARHAQYELDAAVDGWAAKFPAVRVTKLVIADEPALALTTLTHRALTRGRQLESECSDSGSARFTCCADVARCALPGARGAD